MTSFRDQYEFCEDAWSRMATARYQCCVFVRFWPGFTSQFPYVLFDDISNEFIDDKLRAALAKELRQRRHEPHNLRASRETELVEKYPVQVVTDWLGNTPKVAMRHYLMTTDAHFEDAVKGDRTAVDTVTAEASEKAAQQAHAGVATSCTRPK